MGTRKKDTSFKELFDDMIQNWANANLTLNEVADNSGVPRELLRILVDSRSTVVEDLSKVFQFSNVKIKSNTKPICK